MNIIITAGKQMFPAILAARRRHERKENPKMSVNNDDEETPQRGEVIDHTTKNDKGAYVIEWTVTFIDGLPEVTYEEWVRKQCVCEEWHCGCDRGWTVVTSTVYRSYNPERWDALMTELAPEIERNRPIAEAAERERAARAAAEEASRQAFRLAQAERDATDRANKAKAKALACAALSLVKNTEENASKLFDKVKTASNKAEAKAARNKLWRLYAEFPAQINELEQQQRGLRVYVRELSEAYRCRDELWHVWHEAAGVYAWRRPVLLCRSAWNTVFGARV